MTSCVIKVCRNYKGRLKTTSKVTYHRIPTEPTMNKRWVDIIRKSRDEDSWKPSKTTVICSDHFRRKDLYFVSNQKRRRLKKEAIPSKALYLSSVYSEESESSDENNIHELSSDAASKKSEDIHLTSTLKKSESVEDFSDPDSTFVPPISRIQKKFSLKIQLHRRQNFRLKKEIASFKKILITLIEERYIDNDTYDILSNNVLAAELYTSMKKKSKRPVSKYTTEFRKFCLTLHFLSPDAYSYVRRKFETYLPHPRIISKWYTNIDGSPGLTEDAFKILYARRIQMDENLTCALIAGEMAIRQQKCFNEKTKQDEGLVDIGTGPNENMNITASEAYVFLLVSLNEPWKLPVAYFLIHGMTGVQKANIIKTVLTKCHEVGVDVVSLTFNGNSSNLSAMKILGCKLGDPRRLKTTFKHPCTNCEVAVFLDFCHMLKLIRNHFQLKETFSYKNQQIKWEYVKKLSELQEEIGRNLANRLITKNIQFRNSIMNVKLETQLLSRSVSEAIEFCRQELKLSDFENSEATENFIMILNNVFDTFNSRNFQAHGHELPLCLKNKNVVFEALDKARDIILNLCVQVSRKRTYKEKKITMKSFTPVLQAQCSTGLLGVLICINSLRFLYKSLIESNTMRSITTYHISQDRIELFFGAIRMHGDYIDNPNARQFNEIYRKLLCHIELKSAGLGNCVPVENISILKCSSALKCINETTPLLRKDDEVEREKEDDFPINENEIYLFRLLDDSKLVEYRQQVVGYIAGRVVRCLSRQLQCTACIEMLLAHEVHEYHKLVSARDEGGLIYASSDVYFVCNTTETIFRKLRRPIFVMASTNHHTKIVSTVMKQFIGSNKINFKVKSDHVCGLLHQINLIRLVTEMYLCIRCHHITKLQNLNGHAALIRKLFKKHIHSEGD